MARYLFAGTTDDMVIVRTPGGLMKTIAATLTFWDAPTGGTQHTDLLLDGAPVTDLTIGADGLVPAFEGPDGVDEMWVQVTASVDQPAARSLLRARGAGADPAGTAQTLIDQLKAGAPGTLDNLDELAAALGDDPSFATTILGALAGKQDQAALPGDVAALDADPASQLRQEADARLSATYAGKVDEDNGGNVLAPIRVPTLVVDEYYPRGLDSTEILWVDADDKRYGVGRDNYIYTRTTAAPNWAAKGRIDHAIRPGAAGAFIKLRSNASPAKGALLCLSDETPRKVYRSTAASDGAAWTAVYTLPANHEMIGPTGFAEDQVTGYVYTAFYNGTDPATLTEHQLVRSTDGGLTWSTFATLPGQAGTADPSVKVRHIHGVQWDPISQRIYYMVGDSDQGGGIYRVNAAGDGIEKVVTNADIGADPETGYYRATVINVAFMPDYIVWNHDQARGGIHALHRSKIGAATPADVELLYRPNSTGWFATRASSDGSMWVLSSSNEDSAGGAALDKATHLYAVWQDGTSIRVWEVAADKSEENSWAALAPVGQPDMHGAQFWLRRHSYGHIRHAEWRCRLARGGAVMMPQPDPIPTVYGWITRDSGAVTVAAGATHVIGRMTVPRTVGATQQVSFRCFNMGIHKTGGSGAAKVQVYNVTKGLVHNETVVADFRGAGPSSSSQVWYTTASPLDIIEFRIVETSGTASWTGSAFVTYGTGEVGAV